MKQKVARMTWNLVNLPHKTIHRYIKMPWQKNMLGSCGKNVFIGPKCNITWHNTYIADDVSIGYNTMFLSTRAKIYIGNHVMFGPNVSVITGSHRIDILGRHMKSITDSEKLPENDQDVIFQGDNWIGANAVILKGVIIGYGSIIATNAVITKDIPPYTIWGGVPAKQIGERFTKEERDELLI